MAASQVPSKLGPPTPAQPWLVCKGGPDEAALQCLNLSPACGVSGSSPLTWLDPSVDCRHRDGFSRAPTPSPLARRPFAPRQGPLQLFCVQPA